MASPRWRAAWMAISRFSLSLLCPVNSASRRGRSPASNCRSSAWRSPETSFRSGTVTSLPYQFQGAAEKRLEVGGGAGRLGLAHRRFGLRAGAAQVEQGGKHVLIHGAEGGGKAARSRRARRPTWPCAPPLRPAGGRS